MFDSVRDHLQNTAVQLAINNVIPLLIGPSKTATFITQAREPSRVRLPLRRTDTDGLPSQEVSLLIWLNLEMVPKGFDFFSI